MVRNFFHIYFLLDGVFAFIEGVINVNENRETKCFCSCFERLEEYVPVSEAIESPATFATGNNLI